MTLRFGMAAAELAVPVGLPMAGYGARTGVAEGVLDPLYCRAAVLRDENGCVVLVGLDVMCVSRGWADGVRATIAARLATRPENVLIAAIHTHAGPAVFTPAAHAHPGLRELESALANQVVAVASQAAQQCVPARLSYGTAAAEGVGACRRDPATAIDRNVRALVATTADDHCLGAIAAVGCHPTILPPSNLMYSRDLFGAAADHAVLQLGAPVLLLNGAAADVSTRFTRQAQTVDEVQRLGRHLGDAVAAAVRGAAPCPAGPVAGRCREVPITLRDLPSPDAAHAAVAEAHAAREALREASAAPGELRRATAALEGALAQLALSLHGGAEALLGYRPQTALVQRLDLGGCTLIGVAGEVFSNDGARICSARGTPTLLAGYANDYLGYLLPADLEGGYEALIAVVDAESAARVVAAALAI